MSEDKKVCGIVMPISPIDGCDEGHWNDVYEILKEAISMADFEGNLVSYADDVGIIQKRIIQNLYDNPIVVCDVSGKNPNVMFELGMRLAFDKPTIIVKDNITTYSFDTSPIEHIEYPRDLRFAKIVEFKEKLAHKITSISQKSIESAAYSPFLQHFGEFKVAKINQKEVSGQEYIIEELNSIKLAMARMDRRNILSEPIRRPVLRSSIEDPSVSTDICLGGQNPSSIEAVQKFLIESPDIIKEFELYSRGEEHLHLIITVYNPSDLKIVKEKINSLRGRKRRPINHEPEK